MAYGDFPIDPSVKKVGKGGVPPDGHAHRCQSKTSRGDGEQCKKWASKGQVYCRFHKGKAQSRNINNQRSMSFYSRHATGRLKEMIEAASEAEDRLDIGDEVDTARALCQEAIKVCSVVMDPPIDPATGEPRLLPDQLRLTAVQVAQSSLEHVSKLVERMVKIMAMSEATFNSQQVDNICSGIINLLMRRLEDQPEVFDAIVKDIENMKAVKKTDIQIHIT